MAHEQRAELDAALLQVGAVATRTGGTRSGGTRGGVGDGVGVVAVGQGWGGSRGPGGAIAGLNHALAVGCETLLVPLAATCCP